MVGAADTKPLMRSLTNASRWITYVCLNAPQPSPQQMLLTATIAWCIHFSVWVLIALEFPSLFYLPYSSPLQESRHYVRTASGDSQTYYRGRQEVPFQGSGQGNASSSPFWLIVSSVIIEMMHRENICATFAAAKIKYVTSYGDLNVASIHGVTH